MISRLLKTSLEKKTASFVFLKDFIKDPLKIGAIWESSDAMARAMIDDLAIGPEDAVMELGPGTGVFTRQIREKTKIYVGIEQSPEFTRILDRRFPDLNFINGLAEDGFDHYQELGFPPPKVIISGLPLAIWPNEQQDAIVKVLDNLMEPGCIFRTFLYVHSYVFSPAIRFRRKMNALCGPYYRSPIVLRNLPPAFILTWQRP